MISRKCKKQKYFLSFSRAQLAKNLVMVLPLSAVDVNRTQPAIRGRKVTSSNGNNRPNSRSSIDVVVLCFVVAGCVVAMISFLGSSVMMHHMDKVNDPNYTTNKSSPLSASTGSAIQNSLRKMQQSRPTAIEVDDLDHEGSFRKLIKSCLPYDTKTHTPIKNTKCGTYIPDYIDSETTNKTNIKPKQTKMQRIAILAPPGDLSGSLINRVVQIVHEYNKIITSEAAVATTTTTTNTHGAEQYLPMELVVTSHIPPYGYGKTHGYTKIIRLIPEPLLLEVTDAITAILRPGETHELVTLTDVQQVLRQVLRYHCRLNHLSAHTAILSIKFMDLFADPIGITQQIRAFLYPSSLQRALATSEQQQKQLLRNKQGKDTALDAGEEGSTTDDDQSVAAGEGMALDAEQSIDDDQGSLMDSELAYGSQILTSIQQKHVDHHGRSDVTVGRTLLDILDATLVDEFRITKDMSQWPCLSFWDTTSATTNDTPTTMSDVVQRLAQKLSPDCNDPYNNCFVRRDQCEFVGDAECTTTTTTTTVTTPKR